MDDNDFIELSRSKLQQALEYICDVYNVSIDELAISQDNRVSKQSSHIIVSSVYTRGTMLRELVKRDKKKMIDLSIIRIAQNFLIKNLLIIISYK